MVGETLGRKENAFMSALAEEAKNSAAYFGAEAPQGRSRPPRTTVELEETEKVEPEIKTAFDPVQQAMNNLQMLDMMLFFMAVLVQRT